ncbi:MAG: hypothetical protein EPO01_01175 [Aquabacterium sp.]|nr:MAG: hypothetical protein EPO01_01175 [Aquabacterium sp.]
MRPRSESRVRLRGHHMKRWILGLGLLLGSLCAYAEQVVDLEGTLLPATARVGGADLQLNGASVRKRGYFKAEVLGLYLPGKANSVEAAVKLKGPKRLHIVILRDLDGATISRYFVNDFKLSSTEAEFKQLINEIGQIGAIYGNLHRVNKGDVVTIDWIPGKGMVPSLNGKVLSAPIPNELMFDISLRISAGANAPADSREGLMGQRPLKFVEATTTADAGKP